MNTKNDVPKKDLENIKISDVIDLDFLQKFQDNFAKSVGTAISTVDTNGKPVVTPSRFTNFCTKLTRKSKIGSEKCKECDKNGGLESYRTGKPAIYKCHTGLVDYAAPIILKGKVIGNIVGGQILTEPPDENKFKKIAEEIGVNPDEYVEAVKKIEIMDKERIDAIANVVYLVSNALSRLGYNQYELKNMGKSIGESLDQMSASMEELSSSAVTVSENQQSLNKEIKNIKELSSKIHEIIGSIKSIAEQTNMLGLNAAIEAARAGEYGRGFGVVANEIRKLSDSSKETAVKVVDLTKNIQDSVSKTLESSDQTSKTTENQAAAIEQINSGLQEVLSMSAHMNELAEGLK